VPVLPKQLPLRRFVCVLRKLGYRPQKAGQGPLRMFFNATREPHTVSLREPHPSDTLRQAMLHDYLRKLMLTPDEFTKLLKGC
jgi:hypothetical protein